MTLARIYLADNDSGKWVPLMESPHNLDNVVSLALAQSPELIPGDQVNPEKPCRWLLVRPGSSDAQNGSLAILLVDQSAIPTFVICQDTAGAEVQGQLLASMIKQATRGTTGLLGGKIHLLAAETAAEAGLSLQEEMARLLGGEPDDDAFWAAVENNLRRRRLRLIFVADQFSNDFCQVLNFLDQTMKDVEVLALEIKQYLAAGQTALSPRLVKSGEEAPVRESEPAPTFSRTENPPSDPAPIQADPVQAPTPQTASPIAQPEVKRAENGSNGFKPGPDTRFEEANSKMWNSRTFFGDLSSRSEESQVLVGRQIYNWARKNASRVEWGGGSTRGAFAPIYKQGLRECQLFVVTSNGWVELNLRGYQAHPPYNQYDKMDRFFHKLRIIEELDLPEEALEKRALVPLSLFTDPSRLAQFLKVFEWAMVNMEASTGELTPLSRPVSQPKPNVAWPQPGEDADGEAENSDAAFTSYESTFDELLTRKRVELDDQEPTDLTP